MIRAVATSKKSKAKQRCVMGVGMCLYAQLVRTNNTWCKSAIIMRYHPYLSGFCSRPRLTQPYSHIIYPAKTFEAAFRFITVTVSCMMQRERG